MSRTIAKARDTAAVLPFTAPRLRFIFANLPPTPNARPTIPPERQSLRPLVAFAANFAPRFDTREPWALLSESMMVVELARRAGIHTDKNTVISVSTTAMSTTAGLTASSKGTTPLPAICEMAGPRMANVAAQPPMPMITPSGMPMMATHNASRMTARRSCLRVAPTDESNPNWLVRSATDMAKALKMSETHAKMITVESTMMSP